MLHFIIDFFNDSTDHLTYEEQLQIAITLSASETQQQMSENVAQVPIATSILNITTNEQSEPRADNNPSINGDILPIENSGHAEAVANNTLSIINTHNDHSTNSTIDREAIYAWLREEVLGNNNNPSSINEENAQPNEPEQPILVNTYWDNNEDTGNGLINTDFTLATEDTQPENNNDNYSFNQADQDAIYQFLRNEALNANNNQVHSIEVVNDNNDYDALLAQAIELSLENNGRTDEAIARSLQEQQDNDNNDYDTLLAQAIELSLENNGRTDEAIARALQEQQDAEFAARLQQEEQNQQHNHHQHQPQHNHFEHAISGLIPNLVHAFGGNNHDHGHIIDGMNAIYHDNPNNPLALFGGILGNILVDNHH